MRRRLWVALLCLCLCAGMARATEETIPEAYEPGSGYESLGSADIYVDPQDGAAYAGHLATGEVVTVLDNQGDWVQVEAPRSDGTSVTGWLLRSGIGRIGYDMPYFGKAYVSNPNSADLLNLRKGPGKEYASLGLYYNGAEALCWSDPEEGDWVLVTIGQVAGYMQRQYLRMETEGVTAAASTPIMVVTNLEAGQGLNLREGPDLSTEALGLYPNGQRVVVLGVSGEWAHVQMLGEGRESEPNTGDGVEPSVGMVQTADEVLTTETGYMLRRYLVKGEENHTGLETFTLAPAETLRPVDAVSPALKKDGRGAEGFRYFERGYTVVCAVSELHDVQSEPEGEGTYEESSVGRNEGERSEPRGEDTSGGNTADPKPALAEGSSVGRYYAHTIAAYDGGFAAEDGIVAFRLYLNGEAVATLEPYDEEEADPKGIPTIFRTIFEFEGEMESAHLIPVLAAEGERPAEMVSLMLR